MGPTRTGMNLERTVADRPARDIIPLDVSKIRTTISSKLATVGTHTININCVERVGPWRIFYQVAK